ncbi:MurT ligase domain-containing protein [Candidatus Poriferisocius sp.]|uniref:Mur ligase family protein n=1 Tax=Candidatus Poriferisocius sp. TaxID=3101276 RepID=UPI003B022703
MKLPSLSPALAAGAARGAGHLSRRLGRGGGTTLPGLLLTRLRPEATAEMARSIPGGVALLSGTNGKTTTARLVRAVLDASGARVVANTAGSNLERGVATALLDAGDAEVALFEVDEAALPGLIQRTRPRVVTLMNLFRDQLDRYGEMEHLVERWREAVAGLDQAATVVFNADDPAMAEIATGHPNTISYGVDDTRVGSDRLPHAADVTGCRRCGAPLRYGMVTIAHLGRWSCPACGLFRGHLDVAANRVELHALDGQRLSVATPRGPIEVSLRLPGLHNAYNALAATATALALGLDLETVGPALARRGAAFGRAERIDVGGVRVTTLLAKNPAGANENIRTMLLEDRPLRLLVLLNDRTADGKDVSWIWDVDYELLLEGDRLASLTIGGDRAHEMALRFCYAGLAPHRLLVVPPVAAAFDTALSSCDPGTHLYVLPTYTALLAFQALLSSRGLAPSFWQDR